MNKNDLIDAIAAKTGSTKAAAKLHVDALMEVVTESLKQGSSVALIGFGTFELRERAARTGRNPKTGATMEIAASRVPAFKVGKSLKDSVAK